MAKNLTMQSPVAVIFGAGGSKPSKNPRGANPTKAKPVMIDGPASHASVKGPADTHESGPTHEERLHNAAADEHVNAARDYVAGRISSKDYTERKKRAASFMANTPKNKR
jgi:hypothetical protein